MNAGVAKVVVGAEKTTKKGSESRLSLCVGGGGGRRVNGGAKGEVANSRKGKEYKEEQKEKSKKKRAGIRIIFI